MKVTVSLTVDARVAPDIALMHAKLAAMPIAAQHPQVLQLLAKACRAIENAAGYQRTVDRQATRGA